MAKNITQLIVIITAVPASAAATPTVALVVVFVVIVFTVFVVVVFGAADAQTNASTTAATTTAAYSAGCVDEDVYVSGTTSAVAVVKVLFLFHQHNNIEQLALCS
jgi:uncharacterized membrane protein